MLGSQSLNFSHGFQLASLDCNNFLVVKTSSSPVLQGLKDRFKLSQQYLSDFSWRVSLTMSELKALGIDTLL